VQHKGRKPEYGSYIALLSKNSFEFTEVAGKAQAL
jgi:hypothetical protein